MNINQTLLAHRTDKTQRASRKGFAPRDRDDANDTAHLGAPTSGLAMLRAPGFLRPKPAETAADLKAGIESLHAKIVSDEDHASKWDQWHHLIAQAERYLAMPDSFDEPDFGPIRRVQTNDAQTVLVDLHVPRPYLAGSMARTWRYIQTKTPNGVHLQQIGADDTTCTRSARLWRNGAEEGMTVLGIAVGSTRDIYPTATVYTRQAGEWHPAKDRFTSDAASIEGRSLFLTEDGSLCLEQVWTGNGDLELAFDGDSPRVCVQGGQETYHLEFSDGRYALHVPTPEERTRQQHEREVRRLTEALEAATPPAAIVRDGDRVSIGKVTLPVRKIGAA